MNGYNVYDEYTAVQENLYTFCNGAEAFWQEGDSSKGHHRYDAQVLQMEGSVKVAERLAEV